MTFFIVLGNIVGIEDFKGIYKTHEAAKAFADKSGGEVQSRTIRGELKDSKIYIAERYDRGTDLMEFLDIFTTYEDAVREYKRSGDQGKGTVLEKKLDELL